MSEFSRFNGGVGLIQNVPKEILSKLKLSNIDLNNNSMIEIVIISGKNSDSIDKFVVNLGGSYYSLGYGFGIVNISVNKITDLLSNTDIQYLELPLNLITTDINSVNAVCAKRVRDDLKLYGSGVLVGFIDSGIDYTHNAFLNEDRTTRIEYIYDLSGSGKVYDKNIINEALKSEDPYSIVNVVDVTEHGTHVAGIACAGGKIPKEYYGIAPKSHIIMVKSTRGKFSLSTQIMKGLKFLIDKSKELKMPIVINLSLSTNDGAHNGSSLLEKYVESISGIERITICIAGGNEGDSAHHFKGNLEGDEVVDINVANDESSLIINLYKPILSEITIEVINPSGDTSKEIFINQGYVDGTVGDDIFLVYTTGPKPFDLSGEIIIGFSTKNEYLTGGRWRLIIRKKNDFKGDLNIWLPISEGLNINTKFLNPSLENTLGIPATVENIISVGSYNSNTNTISTFTGRGKVVVNCTEKPDLVAPGEGVISTVPDNNFDSKTGTSMATPHVAGISALFMEWGIVKGNDKYLFGERLKYYLIQGAKRNRKDIKYPDISWGYGEVCAYNSIQIVKDTINSFRGDYDISIRKRKNRIEELKNNKNIDNKKLDSKTKIEEKKIEANDNKTKVDDNKLEGNNNKVELNKNTDIKSLDNSCSKLSLIVEIESKESFYKILAIPGVTGIILKEPFALIIYEEDKYDEIKKLVTSVVIYDIPPIYTLCDLTPLEASGANMFNNSPYLNLNGRDVLIGILDTGIDYLNKEFMNEDDTTRILKIWDQTLSCDDFIDTIGDIKYGEEFDEVKINEAINAKKNGLDPYAIVNSKDENGHGTAMASIIGGRGINKDLRGVAFDCKFVIVKLDEASKAELNQAYITPNKKGYSFSSIYLGLRYMQKISAKFNKPLVIYVPLGSNIGAHDGTGILEGYIENLSKEDKTVIVVPSGNEGDTATHTEGVFNNVSDIKEIEVKVGKDLFTLPLQIWINKPNIVKLSITSPSGEIVDNLISQSRKESVINFVYEGTKMIINYNYPDLITGDALIAIRMSKLREGIWKFRLQCQKRIDGKYFAWMPQRKLLDEETRFLNPSELTTLTLPGTTEGAITVSAYNQNNNATVGFSGRGYTRNNNIKPDIVAGGINAKVAKLNNEVGVMSGTSVAGAVVAGCVALLLQWGIVEGNEPVMYSTTIKSYLISGARNRGSDLYPNNEWGYGILDIQNTFEFIRGNFRSEKNNTYEEYNINGLFLRIPKKN